MDEYELAKIRQMVKLGLAEWSKTTPGQFYLTEKGRRHTEREEGWPKGILG